MTIQTKRASNLLIGLFFIHCIPVIKFCALALRDFNASPGSEKRAWAYLPLLVAIFILLPWASTALLAAYGLRKRKLYGWILALIFCIVNIVFSIIGVLWEYMIPVYLGIIWYLYRKQTRSNYISPKPKSGYKPSAHAIKKHIYIQPFTLFLAAIGECGVGIIITCVSLVSDFDNNHIALIAGIVLLVMSIIIILVMIFSYNLRKILKHKESKIGLQQIDRRRDAINKDFNALHMFLNTSYRYKKMSTSSGITYKRFFLALYEARKYQAFLFCIFEKWHTGTGVQTHQQQGEFGKSVGYAIMTPTYFTGNVIVISRKYFESLNKMQQMVDMMGSLSGRTKKAGRTKKKLFYILDQTFDSHFSEHFAVITKSEKLIDIDFSSELQSCFIKYYESAKTITKRTLFDPKGFGHTMFEISQNGILITQRKTDIPRDIQKIEALLKIGDDLKTALNKTEENQTGKTTTIQP